MTIDSRSLWGRSLLALLVAWAVYTSVQATGHFLSLLPKYRAESAWLIFVVLAGVAVLWGWRSIPASSSEISRVLTASQLSVIVLCFAVAGFALYAGSLRLGLLSDDYTLLEHARRHEFIVRSWHSRPLPLALWALLGGAWSLHAFNVLLHGVNAALVVVLARRLGASMSASVLSGVLFLCFPAAVEPVAWASGVQDVLVTTCCLSFVLATGFTERPRLVMPLSVLALVAALATKETAVVAPVLAAIAWLGAKERWNARPVLWGAVLVVAYAALRFSMFQVDSTFLATPSRYFIKEMVSRAFSALAIPFTGNEMLRFPVGGIVMAWLFAALVVMAVLEAWRDRGFAVRLARCAAWVLASVVPVWSAFFVSADLQGSRYLYLAASGWSVLVGSLLLQRRTSVGRAVAVVISVVLVAVWAAGVRSHLRDWHEAAELRDRVLASAVTRLQDSRRPVVHFADVPDSVRGAYVFRNGFLEALHQRGQFGATAMIGGTTDAGCILRWRDGAFR